MRMKRPLLSSIRYRRLRKAVAILIVVCLPLLATSAAPLNGTTTQEKSVMGGGGGYSESGTLTVHGTIGQALAGTSSSGVYELDTGFWTRLGAWHQVYLPLVLRGF